MGNNMLNNVIVNIEYNNNGKIISQLIIDEENDNSKYIFILLKDNKLFSNKFYSKNTKCTFEIIENGLYRVNVVVKSFKTKKRVEFTSKEIVVDDLSDKIDKKSISIFGSCITRDSINVNCLTNLQIKLDTYVARQNIVSSISKPIEFDIDDMYLESNFQKNMVVSDMEKTAFKLLGEKKSDYLIIDLFEERYSLYEYQNTYFTASEENQKSQIFSDVKKPVKIEIDNNGEYYFKGKKYKEYIQEFVAKILKIYSQDKIIIHKAVLADSYIDEKNIVHPILYKYQKIHDTNKIMSYAYKVLIELLPNSQVIDLTNNYYADENHIWGLSPTHYQENYYKNFSNELAKIIFGSDIAIVDYNYPIKVKKNLFGLSQIYKNINIAINESKIYKKYDNLKRETPYRIYTLLSKLKKHKSPYIKTTDNSKPNVAFICDQMTWDNFSPLCNAAYITPDNYLETFKNFKPDFLFCEATWRGISEFKSCWRTKVYNNRNIKYENRKDLLNIIEYCNKNNIKTVFWNKEDPYFIHDDKNNFFDTALLFDYIFTTGEECIPLYKEQGKKEVYFLPFGFAPWIFNPLNREKENRSTVFAGSWYPFAKDRIKDTSKIFNYIINKGYNLNVYDRNKTNENAKTDFPQEYTKYIKPAVNYNKIGDLYRANDIAININTTKNSKSMFARRVYEIMACATGIITNESKAMRKFFPNTVAYIDDENIKFPNNDDIRQNLKTVFKEHTINERFYFLCKTVIGNTDNQNRIFVFGNNNIACNQSKNTVIFNEIESYSKLLDLVKEIDFKPNDYAIYLYDNVDLDYLLSQFLFIPENTAVMELLDEHYHIIKRKDIENVLFKADYFKNIVLNSEEFSVYLA